MVTTGAYVDVEGFDITLPTGDANNAIVWLQGSYSRAIGNLVHDLKLGCTSAGSNGGSGINASGVNYDTHHQEILGNVVRDMGTGPRDGSCRLVHGIYAAQPDVKVVNNVVYRSIGDGISSWHGATRLTIVNNTSIANGGSGITIGAGDGGTTAEGHRDSFVANNIVTGNAINGVGESGRPNGYNVYRNNLSFGNRYDALNITGSSVQSGTVIAEPLYVDAGADDFRVQSGSQAVDSGTSERAPASDIAGTSRAQGAGFDRGAYER
jgi:hypothetical protein